MRIKQRLTRAEQRYLLWKIQKLARKYQATEDELTLIASDLIFSLLVDPEDATRTCTEDSPFGTITVATPEAVEEFLRTRGIETLQDEMRFLDELLETEPALFFLTRLANPGLDTGSGANLQATNVENATPERTETHHQSSGSPTKQVNQ
jgi:hypothetical protein